MLPDIDLEALHIVFVALATYLAFKWICRSLESKKPFEGLPMPAGSNWLGGHSHILMMREFATSMNEMFLESTNEYGQMGFWVYNMPMLSVSDSLDARNVLRHEYVRKRMYLLSRHFNRFLGPRNIGILTGREWKIHRAAILRSFSAGNMASSRRIVQDVTKTAVESLLLLLSRETQTEFDVEALVKMIAIDAFIRIAISKDLACCKTLSPSPIATAFDYLGQELARRLNDPFRPADFFYGFPTRSNRRHYKERCLLMSFIDQVIAERRSLKEGPCDVLSELIRSVEDSEDPCPTETLQGLLLSVLFAGYDTSSITLSYALYLISQHPQVEEFVHEEIQYLKSAEGTENLKYCEAVVYETLRLFPPATVTNRCLQRPLQLKGGFVAQEGTVVMIPIWSIQRDPKNYPLPEEFRPDRWVKRQGARWIERPESDVDNGEIPPARRDAFLAFSAGARSCAGQKFALNEMVLMLAGLLESLRFRAVAPVKPYRSGILQRAKDGVPMIISPR